MTRWYPFPKTTPPRPGRYRILQTRFGRPKPAEDRWTGGEWLLHKRADVMYWSRLS